jgi:hypothetical protein
MVSYKKLWLEEKEKLKQYLESTEKTGMACPLCLEKDIKSELIWYNVGELVCENEECSFDKTMGVILEGYYWYKGIGSLECA